MKNRTTILIASLLIVAAAPAATAEETQTISGTILQSVQWWGGNNLLAMTSSDVAQIDYTIDHQKTPDGIVVQYARITVTSAQGTGSCAGQGDDVEGSFDWFHASGVGPFRSVPCERMGPTLTETGPGTCRLGGFISGWTDVDLSHFNEVHLQRGSLVADVLC